MNDAGAGQSRPIVMQPCLLNLTYRLPSNMGECIGYEQKIEYIDLRLIYQMAALCSGY
jgi:hypothetical protein